MSQSADFSPREKTLNVSIVAFRNDPDALKKLRDALEATASLSRLYLIDNDQDDELRSLFSVGRSQYIRSPGNVGFGEAHNVALRYSLEDSVPFHLVLNPDVAFDPETLDACVDHISLHPDLALLMPRVLYPDGRLQRLCKLLPNPMILAARRLVPGKMRHGMDYLYELHDYDYKEELDVPALSGCFMLMRTSMLAKAGLFDEKFFMYMEDFDLCRRLGQWGRTVCWPKVEIYHHFARGSASSPQLLLAHIKSAVYYFNKWGWLTDSARETFNQKTLNELSQRKQSKKNGNST